MGIDDPHSWCNIYDMQGRLIQTMHVNDYWAGGAFDVFPDKDGMTVIVLKRISSNALKIVGAFHESYEFVSDFIKNWTGNDLDTTRWNLDGKTQFASVEGKEGHKEFTGEAIFGIGWWTFEWEKWAEKHEKEKNERITRAS